jgi:hypothetical protein
MTRSYDYFLSSDFEREYLTERILIEESIYLEEQEFLESGKNRNFEVRGPRKPNSKYGRAKIIKRKASKIREICKASKYKSSSL